MIMVEYDRSRNPPAHRSDAPPHHYPTHTTHQPHHGSPHLQHLDRPSAHSTPSPPYSYSSLPHLSQQPGPAHRQTPTSYPSPHSYPSPSIHSAGYQYSSGPQPPSRGSPYSQPSSARNSPYQGPSTINLPPIRLTPPSLPPPEIQPTHGSPLLGSPLPQPPLQTPMYYGALPSSAVLHSQITSSPIHTTLRYPLPSVNNQERIMSGGRHKKEIKRRTKTGCLTCRKRRIKCDEGHPTCKNCQKSKRDCLGYDPIFKSQPGPAAIQPAPSGGSTPHSLQQSPSSGTYTFQISSVGQGYAQTMSGASSPASTCDSYDYPLDPALDATSHPHVQSASTSHPDMSCYRPDLKRGLDQDRTSPFSTASEPSMSSHRSHGYHSIPRSSTPTLGGMREGGLAKRIKIDDLLSVSSVASTPQPLSPPQSEPTGNAASSVSSTSVESNVHGLERDVQVKQEIRERDAFKQDSQDAYERLRDVGVPRDYDSRDLVDTRESYDSRDPRDSREAYDSRDPRDARDMRDIRDVRPIKNERDARDYRDERDARDGRDIRDYRDERDARDGRDGRDPRDPRDTRDVRDGREERESDARDHRDSREIRDTRKVHEATA